MALLPFVLVLIYSYSLCADSYHSYFELKESSLRYLKRHEELSEGRTLPGSFKWAPSWLQKHKSHGLYFPIVHSKVIKEANILNTSTSASEYVSFDLGGKLNVHYGYYITVAIGSQRQVFNLHVDTGSALTWVPCDCEPDGCAENEYLHPPLDTSASSSGSFISCNSSLCNKSDAAYLGCHILNEAGSAYLTENATAEAILPDADTDINCEYLVTYADKSLTAGNLFSDLLELQFRSNITSVPVIFGCGRKQGGNTADGSSYFDGLVGLGRNSFSLTYQLPNISSSFSICMEGNGLGGHLVLGATLNPEGSYSTPLIDDGYIFYTVEISQISFNGSSGVSALYPILAIIDSGTTLTYLAPDVFTAVSNDILTALTNPATFDIDGLTCILPSALQNIPDSVFDNLPDLFVILKGGSPLVIGPNAYTFSLQLNSGTYLCLSFLTTDSLSIIGDSWLQNQNIVYDANNSMLHWAAVNCTTGTLLGNATNRIIFPTPSMAADPLIPIPTSSPPYPSPPLLLLPSSPPYPSPPLLLPPSTPKEPIPPKVAPPLSPPSNPQGSVAGMLHRRSPLTICILFVAIPMLLFGM